MSRKICFKNENYSLSLFSRLAAKVLENFHTFEIFIPDKKIHESVLIHSPMKKQMMVEPPRKPTDDYEEMEEQSRPKDLTKKKDHHGRY